jgi:DNA-binding NtrC family response regulator
VVQRLSAVYSGKVVEADDIDLGPLRLFYTTEDDDVTVGNPSIEVLKKRYCIKIMKQTGGSKAKAAKILGVDRKTLERYLDCSKAKTVREPEVRARFGTKSGKPA